MNFLPHKILRSPSFQQHIFLCRNFGFLPPVWQILTSPLVGDSRILPRHDSTATQLSDPTTNVKYVQYARFGHLEDRLTPFTAIAK